MSYLNATSELAEQVADNLAKYMYELASIVEGDAERHSTYMDAGDAERHSTYMDAGDAERHSTYLDAGDALMDVLAMWKEDVAFFAQELPVA